MLLGLDFLAFVFLPRELELLHGSNVASELLRDTDVLALNQTWRDGRKALLDASDVAPCDDCDGLIDAIDRLFERYHAVDLTQTNLVDFCVEIGYPRLGVQLKEVMAGTPPTLAFEVI